MSTSPVTTIRLALAQDAPAMAEMSRTLVEAGLAWRYTPRRMLELLAETETLTIVAGNNATTIHAFAVMQFSDEHAHLMLLCVQPSQQRCGVGRSLLEWLLRSARVAGMASVKLELRVDNADALEFYSRFGFQETQLSPAYYDGRIAARRMVLQLR